jgi:Xaa-Pro aminopeptidase
MRPVITLVGVLLFIAAGAARPLFTDAFPASEFAARRAQVMAAIGEGLAVLQGATELPGYQKFRQSNQFFYLTGVEVPRAILVIDGRVKRSTLFLPGRDERSERSEGPVLVPGTDAERLTGIETVLNRAEFGKVVDDLASGHRPVFAPYRREAFGAATTQHVMALSAASLADPWDGRSSREAAFIARLQSRAAGVTVRDLDPVLDRMRFVKSPREIALIREAARQAGLAIMEAMRSTRPGLYEYELEAIGDFIFKKHNAQGIAYFGLIAAGTNAYYPHYHAAQDQLKDGDLVLYDYAPDFKYYSADVTRQFPVNGRFSASQKELYTIYLRLYRALMASIRPNLTPKAIIEDAARRMEAEVGAFPFTRDVFRDAARRMVHGFRTGPERLGHWVGMEVHDVEVPFTVLRPGMVFTIEPALTIPDDRFYLRLEDTLVVTDTGYENLSAFVPNDVEAVERLMAEEGMLDVLDRDGDG